MSSKFKIGDKVWYRGRWGSADPIAAIITSTGSKDGAELYDCEPVNSQGERWGYASQFEAREEEAAK